MPAWALDRERTLGQFHHTAWTVRDGAPTDVWAIAQTADGWMWFGAPDGLHRFDGVRFESVDLQPADVSQPKAISTLLALETGELWIGYVYGGASVLANGHFTHYSARDGVPENSVLCFEQDAQGGIWATTNNAVIRFDGHRWEKIGPERGLTASHPYCAFRDRFDTLWISAEDQLYSLKRGARKFAASGIRTQDVTEFQQSPDGRTWFSDSSGTRLLPDQAGAQPRRAWTNARSSYVSLFDRDGAWWTLSGSGGVRRIGHPERATRSPLAVEHATDAFVPDNGLSGPVSKTVMEDREGNVWMSTSSGIDRFRQTNVVRAPLAARLPAGHGFAQDNQGQTWVVTLSGQFSHDYDGLWTVVDGNMKRAKVDVGHTTALHRASDGALWLAGMQGFWRQQGDRFVKAMELPDTALNNEVNDFAFDASGAVWASIVRARVFRYRDGRWERNGGLAKLPTERASAVSSDPGGAVWLGYRNIVARVRGDDVTLLGATEGRAVGQVTAISVKNHTIVAGENGIALWAAGRFHNLTTPDVAASSSLTAVLEAADGDVWWIGARGAVQLRATEIARAVRTGDFNVPIKIYDTEEGFPGGSRPLRPAQVLIQDDNGRLWFDGSDGLGWLDPARIQRNEVAPTAMIRSLQADQRNFPIGADTRLPPRPHTLQIDYTALSFTQPERIRFRYRLQGFDKDWQDAGTRRQAFYTNLPPTSYVFEMVAANEDGVWSAKPASIRFAVAPAFFQTRLFQLACVLIALALVWLIYHLRLRQQTARLRAGMEARQQERERIARDLHDTLLQSTQGLILSFQSVARQLSSDSPVRKRLERSLEIADQTLTEGRDRVKGLRTRDDLADALAQVVMLAGANGDSNSDAPDSPVTRLHVKGTARPLRPTAADEIVLILREALLNAIRHSQAGEIVVEIDYRPAALHASVRDDGTGIEAPVLQAGMKPGHWGLQGMHERARQLGGSLQVISDPRSGTCIELTVPY